MFGFIHLETNTDKKCMCYKSCAVIVWCAFCYTFFFQNVKHYDINIGVQYSYNGNINNSKFVTLTFAYSS